MNYSDLTKTQKRCIDAFVKLRPELASQETITRTEIEYMFKQLYDNRTTGGEKIGYPMWLVKGEKTGRGVYKFPAPSLAKTEVKPSKSVKSNSIPQIKSDEEDKEFFTDLKEYGIMETA
jgi:hypothetical protein